MIKKTLFSASFIISLNANSLEISCPTLDQGHYSSQSNLDYSWKFYSRDFEFILQPSFYLSKKIKWLEFANFQLESPILFCSGDYENGYIYSVRLVNAKKCDNKNEGLFKCYL
ncbi:hypothetical protein [Silvanigrella aquatica]|uniref:Uncharacterized protein n=1 Tax=Silvanigrella aquatica TaxID=1915309 RepID=A0A1L4CZT1_9BACT|nr:hypothetical protein [Silvanigrella aquatica]APJ03446.1 hypothetical protein AXG55_05815 [Silvanigrella aquatica]